MSAQQLGPKWLRRLSRETGHTVVRGWAHGGYVHAFVTAEHRHGLYDMKTGDFRWTPDEDAMHYTSCHKEPAK